MTAPTAKILDLICLCLIVPSLVYALITQLWNLPLKNGPGFFMGVGVIPGFYEGPDSRWLTRYRAMLVSVHTVDFGFLVAILAMGQWDWVPVWCGGTAIWLTGSMMAFAFWARHCVGLSPPVLRAALSLDPRRLSDYISWPIEVLCVAAVACTWWMLMPHPKAIGLQGPLTMTWTVLGLLPGKIILARQGWPLPSERAEEHLRAQEAGRRFSIRALDAYGVFMVSVLFMCGLQHAWPAARTVLAAQWLLVAIPLVLAVVLMVVTGRQGRVLAMGRTLRPAGSWTPPFGRARLMSRAGLVWFAVWFGGQMLLMFLVSK